jgi:hypothetical protein
VLCWRFPWPACLLPAGVVSAKPLTPESGILPSYPGLSPSDILSLLPVSSLATRRKTSSEFLLWLVMSVFEKHLLV